MTVPKQPDPEVVHSEMDGGEDAEPVGVQQKVTSSEENSCEPHAKDKPPSATSLLGKRHHSLYASLNSYEGEAIRKVTVCHMVGKSNTVCVDELKSGWAI